MSTILTTYPVFIKYLFWTNIPELVLSLVCLINILYVSKAYFEWDIEDLNYKFFSLKMIKFNIKALIAVLIVYAWHIWSGRIYIFNLYLAVDLYATFFKILIIGTTIFVLKNSKRYILYHLNPAPEYCALLIASCFFLVLLVCSMHLIFMLVCVVGFSLNLYVLIMFDTPYKKSEEACVKYYYLSSLSAGLIIGGIWMVHLYTKDFDFNTIPVILFDIVRSANPEDLVNLNIGVILILFGLFFKLAAYPGHLWASEVYEGCPNPMVAFFVLPVKIAGMAIFIKLFGSVFLELYFLWDVIIWGSALTSMVYGCLLAYNQDSIKKFIAGSSINQMGFLLIGVLCCTFDSMKATILYLLIYILMNLCFLQFYLNTFFVGKNRHIEFFSDLQYYAKNNQAFSIGLVVILFTMAGIPPLAGFFGKYFLFLSAFESEQFMVVIVGLATSLVSAYYYLRIAKMLWFEKTLFDEVSISPEWNNVYYDSVMVINGKQYWYGTPHYMPRVVDQNSIKTELDFYEIIFFFTCTWFLTVFLPFSNYLFYLMTLLVYLC